MTKRKPRAIFTYQEMYIIKEKVGLVVDMGIIDVPAAHVTSVTNEIRAISDYIGCDKIIYSDTHGEWVFWSKEKDFCYLGVGRDFREAVKVVAEKWL